MHLLFFTILCSTSIALILKYSDTKNGVPIVLLGSNYLIAAFIGLIIFLINQSKSFSFQTFLFGAGLGLSFILSFFAYAKAISYAGTGLATTSSRLSVIIPILLSILIFNELPGKLDLIGFFFTAVTFCFFYLSVKENRYKADRTLKYFSLVAVFAGIGINDFALKVYKVWRPADEESFFVFIIFASAFVYSFIYIFIKKIKIDKKTVISGIILGIPNLLSTVFLLGALAALPAILVYPIMNVGIIILTTVLAYIFWKEKLDKWGVLALISGVLAILFLSLQE